VLQARSWLPRAEGTVRLGFKRRGPVTALDVLHQAGAARARFPTPLSRTCAEAILLNTAGGMTGGDRFDISVALDAGAQATVTTAAAEKIYRSRDEEPATLRVRLDLQAGASLAWLPQPAILFDRSWLDRRTDVSLAGDARLLAAECLIFGRAAMGEDVHRGGCRDVWRVRRDGRLIFADALRLDGAVADTLDRAATLDGARASVMLVYIAADAAQRLEAVRALLEGAKSVAGVSSWNGILLLRAIAKDGRTLQAEIRPLIELLSGRALPRIWQC
jgi:urease accessory protein